MQGIKVSGTKSELQVLRIGRDAVLRFAAGDWVEVTDDWRELMSQSGDMARVESIDETTRTLFLDRVVPAPPPFIPFATTPADLASRHTRVIRWDQSAERHGNAVDADGLMTTGAGPIALEDGVQAFFGADPVGGSMRIDDHWSFEARTVDGSIRELDAAEPDGVRHYYTPLAVVSLAAGGGFAVTSDCRNLVPPEGEAPPQQQPVENACDCCTLCVGKGGDVPDLKAALAALPALVPNLDTAVRLCLTPGDHALPGGLVVDRPNTRIVGCFPRSRLTIEGEPLRLAADATGLIDVVVLGGGEPATVVASVGSDILVEGCRFIVERGRTPALLADGGDRFERLIVAGCEFIGAGIGLRGNCSLVRIESNRIERFAGSGIAIESGDRAGEIEILNNRLVDGLGNGIEGNGVIEGLTITGNEIEMCRGERGMPGKIAGGIVLQAVSGLFVADNRIERNGSDARQGCAGLYAAETRGALILRNRISGNGPVQIDGNPIAGGIVIERATPPAATAGAERRDSRPSLVVAENLVVAPRGQALFVVGEGDMRVQDNALLSGLGIARGAGAPGISLRDLAAVVLIGGRMLAELAEKLVQAAAEGPLRVRALIQDARATLPGRIAVQGNQIGLASLDRSQSDRPALSALLVWGFEDVDFSHNQVELELAESRICVDALVVARTTRQAGNRLTEPATPDSCLASLLSHGHGLNGCTNNQGTHCILPSVTAPAGKLAAGLNLVERPSDLCPER
ncbi:hypothetical protein AWB71_00508 [Caballeronia peredens]|nr:hypothetical protein AWB71_00508 [Caballeronia peredens]